MMLRTLTASELPREGLGIGGPGVGAVVGEVFGDAVLLELRDSARRLWSSR